MKKFNFKLSGLLKFRKYQEDKAKVEVGKVNKEIKRCEEEQRKLRADIEEGFAMQEELLKGGISANSVRYIPSFFQAKLEHIQQLENYKKTLDVNKEEKMEVLRSAFENYKTISNMREEANKFYKKQSQKKAMDDLEELYRLKNTQKAFK